MFVIHETVSQPRPSSQDAAYAFLGIPTQRADEEATYRAYLYRLDSSVLSDPLGSFTDRDIARRVVGLLNREGLLDADLAAISPSLPPLPV